MVTDSRYFLAVDIGGTKTEIAVFRLEDDSFEPVVRGRYKSREAAGIEAIINDFLSENKVQCNTVCLGIAGVVGESTAQVTNLPWKIKKSSLLSMGFSQVSMINDMTALSASLAILADKDLFTIQDGNGGTGEVKGVLAPGTGLGEGFLLHSESVFYPRGTEGGHCDFAPVNREQRDVLDWLAAQTEETISYEMLCAGPAIGRLYDFYIEHGAEEVAQVSKALIDSVDRTPVIVEAGLNGICPVCVRVLELFLAILGREAANLVMKVYATRGLFLGGGILPRLVDEISFKPFLDAFHHAGTMAGLMRSVPVRIITRKDAALLGAAFYGKRIGLARKMPVSR